MLNDLLISLLSSFIPWSIIVTWVCSSTFFIIIIIIIIIEFSQSCSHPFSREYLPINSGLSRCKSPLLKMHTVFTILWVTLGSANTHRWSFGTQCGKKYWHSKFLSIKHLYKSEERYAKEEHCVIYTLLGSYGAWSGNFVRTFRDITSVPSSRTTHEDGTDRLSRNVGADLPLYAA